jgi:hypothetical protein
MNKTTPKYFHCYATANDKRLYLRDIQNLLRIKNYYSGYDKILLYVAISKAKKISVFDKIFIKTVIKLFHKHPTVILKDIFCKKNIGRDFSSFQSLFLKVKNVANSEDYIFFQNRSGYGPYQENWYSQFVNQFNKFNSIALCGSTINFMDHPKRSLNSNLPHLQTFSFLSKVSYLNMLNEFPGSKEKNRLNIVLNGEIGLSQFFLEKGYKITCIEWPNEEISNQSKPLTLTDIKSEVKEKHFFYHRSYFKKHNKRCVNKTILNYYIDYLLVFIGLKK